MTYKHFMLTYDIKKLERARVIKGWSKARLAKTCGFSPSVITWVWKGQAKRADTMKNIAEALGLSVEEILLEEK